MTTEIEFRVGNAVGTAQVYNEHPEYEGLYLFSRGQGYIEFSNVILNGKQQPLFKYNKVLEEIMLEAFLSEEVNM
jgi:hypothetical protein